MIRNITLSAEESHIKKARDKARQRNISLNRAFREWLSRFAETGEYESSYDDLMKTLSYVSPGRKYSRDELNER